MARKLLLTLDLPKNGTDANPYELDFNMEDAQSIQELSLLDQISLKASIDRFVNLRKLPLTIARERGVLKMAPLRPYNITLDARRRSLQTRKDAILAATRVLMQYYKYRNNNLMREFGAIPQSRRL